jgi:hypothetical protein
MGEQVPDALVAVRGGPVLGDGVGVIVGRGAGVGAGDDAAGWVEDLGHLVEWDVAGPLVRGRWDDGNGAERAAKERGGRRGRTLNFGGAEGVRAGGDDGSLACGAGVDWRRDVGRQVGGVAGGWILGRAAQGDSAHGVVADVALIVGVDDVLGGASEAAEGGEKAGPVVGVVYVEGGDLEVGGVVDGPAEGEGAGMAVGLGSFGREDGVEDGGEGVAVAGGEDLEVDGALAFDLDGFGEVDDELPGVASGEEFLCGAGAAGGFDVDVLDVGAEVGEAPGDVVVVADDDEGKAGDGDAGGVESPGGEGGLEIGLVPDAGEGEGEMHVVGEQGLAGGGVGAGDDEVVGAGGEG